MFIKSEAADCTSCVSTPYPGTLVHAVCIETTDFMSIVVFLEEEAFALVAVCASCTALILAVSNSFLVIVGRTVYWVTSAISSAARASQIDLAVGWSIVHEVDGVVTVIVVVRAVSAEVWVHVAREVSLRRGSRHWSDSQVTGLRRLVEWESNYCAIFHSEAASSL